MKKTTEIVSRLISDEILLETKSGNVKISTDEDGKLNIGSLYIPGNENTLIVDPVNNCVTASCLSVGVISASQYIGPIGGGGGGSPASPNNSVQFNNGGSFGGSSNLTFNPSTNILSGTQATFVRITGSFSGSGRNITNVTASNISNFANDVRSQFSAGTNITIVGGVISTTGGGGTPGGTNTTIQFNSGSTFSGSTNLTYDYTNNRLGIGTFSPTNPLHVRSSGEIVKIETTSATGDNYIRFSNGGGNLGYLGYGSLSNNNLIISNEAASSDIQILTNNTERMRVTNNGNILIGKTTNPNSTLDVLGNTILSGNLTVTGSTIITTVSGTTAQFTSITGSHSGSGAGLFGIPNTGLTNSSLTIGSTNIALGATATILQDITVITGSTVTGSTALFTSVTGTFSAPRGSFSAPAYSFTGDSNTGLFSSGSDVINMAVGGAEIFRAFYSAATGIPNIRFGGMSPNFGAFNYVNTVPSGSAQFFAVAHGNSGTFAQESARGGAFIGVRSRGSNASPVAVGSSDSLANYGGVGYNGTGYFFGANMVIKAEDTYSATSNPARFEFYTAQSGSTTTSIRMIISGSGDVTIGKGSSPANARLDVLGNTTISGNLNVTGSSTFTTVSGTTAQFTSITGSHTGSGAGLFNITASGISNFTNDVRGQFSAGTNITIVGGVISSTGGGGTPGGTNTTIQFNSGSTFSGSTQLIYNYTNNILSGTTAQFTTLSASNILIFGTASLFTNPQSAYIVYNSGSDKLVAFPGLIVTGSITGSESISAVTISGTTAQFTTVSASNLFISSSGNVIIDVSSSVSALRITQRGSGESIRVEDSINPDSTPFIIDAAGNIGVGKSTPNSILDVLGNTILSGNLNITGSTTTTTISGTTAQFTTITASNIYPLSFGGNYPLLLGGPEVGMPGWQVIGTGTGGVACPLSSSYIVPFWFGAPITVITASFYVTATVVGARADFSIWRCEFTSSSPAFVPVSRSYVESNIDVSTVQLYNITSSMPLTLDPGFYAAVITSNTSSLTCRGLLYNADSFRSARLSSTDFQLQLLESYTAPTGYPIGTTWSGSISTSTANGALGYRGQVAIKWTQ